MYQEQITLPQYVYLYGGFDGSEMSRPERDWVTNPTVMDGEQAGRVVTVPKAGYLLNTIDGFTIRNGGATNYGAGIMCYTSSPTIRNNTITDNYANYHGGGIELAYSAAVVTNNTISGNRVSSYGGGAIWVGNSSPLIANNVLTENTVKGSGSAIGIAASTRVRIVNNTITANTAQGGGAVFIGKYVSRESDVLMTNNIVAFNSSGILGSVVTLRYNCVFGNDQFDYLGTDPDATDISQDPRLASASYGNVHIQSDSPCRDAGDDSVIVSGWLDMDGQPRIQGDHVDIGADESDGTIWTVSRPIVRVATDGDDANDGSSWALAKRTIQGAIDDVSVLGGEIWVEAGVYQEQITLPQYVYLYGGFDGSEMSRPERDWITNPTVMDGEQAGRVVTVPKAGYLLNTIDGFTIRHGGATNYGGGILCSWSSPLIRNNTITENVARYGGGGILLSYSAAVVTNNTIAGNTVWEYGGGGISVGNSSPLIANNVLTENTVKGSGSAIGVGASTGVRIVNNTITANTAQDGGAVFIGKYVSRESDVLMTNNIVAFNSSGILGSVVTLRHNCIYGNTDYDYSGILPGEGEVSLDPLFVDLAGGDFHLTRESPCVDAGDGSLVDTTWADMDGEPRIQGDGVDIGADERVPNEAPIADAGGAYEVVVGLTVELDGSGSSDPDQPAETLIYEWDLDGDGVLGETGQDAAQGDETGIAPVFSSAGLTAPSMYTVTLRVTDKGDLVDEDAAQIEIYGADLTLNAWDISFAPVNPEPGQPVLITATISNQGVADASGFEVNFLAFDDPIGTVTVPSLAAGQSDQVFIPTQFDTPGLRLITLRIDATGEVRELNEQNNEASAVLQVGDPTGSDEAEIVVDVPAQTAYQGQPTVIGGRADYDFLTTPESPDYPVQGAQVTVSVVDPSTSQVLGVYTGAKTRAGGSFAQGILAPVGTGTYTLLVEVTDNTVTGEFETTLDVIEEPSLPPVTPPSPPPPGGPVSDVSVYSDNIFFTDENPDLGEPIDIFAFVGYVGSQAADNVPVTLNDIFPVAGHLMTFPIGTTFVDFPASPGGTNVAVTIPWANTSDGAHIIQVAVDPAFAQFTGNDRASRLISVGSPIDTLTMTKTVVLEDDADDNGLATPGDTLGYTITYTNTGTDLLTGAVILDDLDEALLQTPLNINDGGTVADGTILWSLGSIASEVSGSVTYQVAIKPPAEFPGGITTVVNTALLDTDQTPPVAATAEIQVTGDMVAPTTTAAVTPEPNGHGWNNTDVNVILTATDNEYGSGVSEIVYSIDGAPFVTVPGDTVSLALTDEGIHSVSFYAIDVVRNVEAAQTVEIKIDKTAPVPVHSGPFLVNEGDSIQLIGTGSTDVLSGVASTTWSLDNDGLFNDGDPASFLSVDGPSTHDVSLQVVDMAGNVAIADTQVSVLNVDPTPSITDISQTRLEGTEIVVTGSATDPAGANDTLTYSWTVDKDGVAFADGSGVDLTVFRFTPDDNADYRIVLTASDEDGGSNTVEQTIGVGNVAPTINDLSATPILENGVTTLSGTIADVGTLDTFEIEIDWDADGVWDETHEDLSPGEFSYTHQFLDDSPTGTPVDNMPINVRVTDDDWGSVLEDTTVEVTNFVPTVDAFVNEFSTCGNVVEGQGISIEVSFTDHGTLDTHKVVVDWGEGKAAETFDVEPGARGWTVGHVYESGGIYDVAIKVTDDDTGSSQEVPTTVIVTGAGINDRVLQIVGTPEDDHVSVNQQGNGLLKVHADFLPGGQNWKPLDVADVDSIRIVLCAGDDHATIAGSIDLPALVEGGPGNDHLGGSGGPAVLLGGDGDDTLTGGSGRDVLIGGFGTDRLVGAAGDDILIGGWTIYDANSTGGAMANDRALLRILAEWNSERPFAVRVANLTDGRGSQERLNDDFFLSLGQTVLDDEDEDILTGSSGEDWFLAGDEDAIIGSHGGGRNDDSSDNGSGGKKARRK